MIQAKRELIEKLWDTGFLALDSINSAHIVFEYMGCNKYIIGIEDCNATIVEICMDQIN